MNNEAPRVVNVHLQIDCAANPETVWRTLVDDIDSWWGQPYVKSNERQSLTLDVHAGGLLFEDWGDGNGIVWATVSALRQPHLLGLNGIFIMTGALHSSVDITLEPTSPEITRLSLTQQATGAISDETIEEWNAG